MTKSVFNGHYRITGCYLQNWGHWAPPAKPHTGLDLVGDDDKRIFAPISGRIGFAGNANDGFGNYVRIEDSKGWRYYFCHMESIAVKTGQQVNAGDQIGVMGHTGNVTGAHTHFEIRIPNGNGGYSLSNPATLLGIPNKQGTYCATENSTPTMITVDVANYDTVSGWALNASRVDIYVDNNRALGSVDDFTTRIDVAKVHPDYKQPNSGFSLNISGKLQNGKHTIKAAAIPKDGGPAVWAYKDVLIQHDLPPIITIDVANGNVVSGWALNASRVDIYFDDSKGLGSTNGFTERLDVQKVYSGSPYQNDGKCGFNLDVKGKLSAGKHTIKAAAIPKDGGTAVWAFKDVII